VHVQVLNLVDDPDHQHYVQDSVAEGQSHHVGDRKIRARIDFAYAAQATDTEIGTD
jgi:hypothetical protein